MLSQREPPASRHLKGGLGLSLRFQPVRFFAFGLCPTEKIADLHILLVRCQLIVLVPLTVLG